MRRDDVDPRLVDLEGIESAVDCGVLVLFPSLESDDLALQIDRQFGHFVLGHVHVEPVADGGYHLNDHGGRSPQAGARRDVGTDVHVEPFLGGEMVGDRFYQVHVPVEGKRASVEGCGISPVIFGSDTDLLVPAGAECAVCIFVYGGVEHIPSFFGGVGVHIGPAAGEADADGGPLSYELLGHGLSGSIMAGTDLN